MENTYSIAQLAREFQITARTIRFYEDRGLLSPRRAGSRRIFVDRDRVRLKLILRGKRLGLTLEEISEIIDMYDPSGSNDARQLVLLCSRIREHRAVLLTKLRDIEATLAAMDDVERGCHERLDERLARSTRRNTLN